MSLRERRRTGFRALLALALVACGGRGGAPVVKVPVVVAPPSAAELAARAAPSLVLIRTVAPEERVGTGFIAWADGRIVTSLHLLAGVTDAVVTLADGREFTELDVLAADPARDLAVLAVRARDLPALTLAPDGGAKAADRVVALAHPRALGEAVTDTHVVEVRDLPDPPVRLLELAAAVSGGGAGGPILDERGFVVGVAIGTLPGTEHGFGVPTSYLASLLVEDNRLSLADFGRATAPRAARGSVPRAVPRHDLATLDDCGIDQLQRAFEELSRAISVGAPLYNDGHHEACYRVYEGTAQELATRLVACAGVKAALLDGVAKARARGGFEEQAWAMRDAFDGVLDVIARKVGGP